MCLFSHVIQDNRQLGKLFSINISVVQFTQKNRENGRSYVVVLKSRIYICHTYKMSESFFPCISVSYTHTHQLYIAVTNDTKWLSKILHVISFWQSKFYECICGDRHLQNFHEVFSRNTRIHLEKIRVKNFRLKASASVIAFAVFGCVCVCVSLFWIYIQHNNNVCVDRVMCVDIYL